MDTEIFAIIFCVVIGLLLLTPMVLSRRKAPEEVGLKPVFETFCSGRFGKSSFIVAGTNVPMFRFSVYEKFVVIAFLKPRVIPFAQIERTKLKSSFLSNRLLIELKKGGVYQLSAKVPGDVLKQINT
jgi:hypothetical protein